MVSVESRPEASSPRMEEAPARAKDAPRQGAWLVPGEQSWEILKPDGAFGFSLLQAIEDPESPAPSGIALVALPASLVTCQLFWLETTDEKAVPDLLRMQCERRALLRQDEVWKYRILRREPERLLAQVCILQNGLPSALQVEGDTRFEALPRCLDLPSRSACLWRSLGAISLAITGDDGVLYFQSLPHHALTRECLRDVQSVLWLATAQDWIESVESVALLGTWSSGDAAELHALGLPVEMKGGPHFSPPREPMELIPRSVLQIRAVRRQQYRTRLVALAIAAVYAVFLVFQIVVASWTAASNSRLQARLDAVMPEVASLQATARRLEALNPALDTKTYPLEVLHRIMAVLPESGVRLTRFEIVGDRLDLAGESSTAREAFDFLHAIQSSESLQYIQWEDPPPPTPLPNDTARFSIQGTITGAYRDAEES